jgi:BlaI family penicillinase repressor
LAHPKSETPTEWELELLKIMWDKGKASAEDVRDALEQKGVVRSNSAVRTILRIMVDKGMLKKSMQHRTLMYEPAVKKPAMEKKIFKNLIKGLFGGNQSTFLLRALDETRLTPAVIDEIEQRIQEHRKKKMKK